MSGIKAPLLLGILGLFVVASLVYVTGLPPDVYVGTDVEEHFWQADGSTVYKMDVYLDNEQMVMGVASSDWTLLLPEYLTLVDYTDYTGDDYPENDFYEGFSTIDFVKERSGEILVSRIALDGFVYETKAPVGTYWFTVNADAPLGRHNFDLPYVEVYNEQGEEVPYLILNEEFRIIAPCGAGSAHESDETLMTQLGSDTHGGDMQEAHQKECHDTYEVAGHPCPCQR